jgi:hypothetical protein
VFILSSTKYLDLAGLGHYNEIIQGQLVGKVDKVDETEIVYGTDETGEQKTYPIAGFGLVNDVLVDGNSVVIDKVALIDLVKPLERKQDSLNIDQLKVISANAYTAEEKEKLEKIEEGSEVNKINSIFVNGIPVPIDDYKVNIDVPTHLTDLNAEIFTSKESPVYDGGIGTLLENLNAEELKSILSDSIFTLGDTVIFANNIQAIVSEIAENKVTYKAIISRIPSEVSFAGIAGDPTNHPLLAVALDAKLSVEDALTIEEINKIFNPQED